MKGRNNKHKAQAFRKRSRESSDHHAGDDDDDVCDTQDKRSGSFPLDSLKETEEYQKRIEIDGPKRKYAICFGYLGTNYQGLQINPDCKSIEAELEKALFLAGGFHECNYASLQKLQWSRAARTDRGVHALAQCCAMKLCIPLDDAGRKVFVDQVNLLLPDDIRVHTLTKVTKAFNSKLACSRRRYHYLLPTYLMEDASIISDYLEEAFTSQGPRADIARVGGFAEAGATDYLGEDALRAVRAKLASYRCSAEKVQLFRDAIAFYQGTKSYHNFTTGKTARDASAQRYIMSFTCSDTFIDENRGVEWVLLSVEGQSFLLNQIRKMVGMASDVARGTSSLETMKLAFTPQKVDVPMIPGLGLYLDELSFDQYNLRQDQEKEKHAHIAAKAARTALKCGAIAVDAPSSTAMLAVSAASGQDAVGGEVEIREGLGARIDVESYSSAVMAEGASAAGGVIHALADVLSSGSDVGVDVGEDRITVAVANEGGGVARVDSGEKEEEEATEPALPVSKRIKCEEVDSIGGAQQRSGAEVGAQQIGDGDADDAVDPAVSVGEPIRWAQEPLTLQTMQKFATEILRPHVFEEEEKGLTFLYYLDFLRMRARLFQK